MLNDSSQEWDICVRHHQLKDAEHLFAENDQYEPAEPPHPVWDTLRHLYPIFKVKSVGFFFILTPSSQYFIDPRPENCEVSMKGILYPKMSCFARALLVSQNRADVADFIDGMDLDEAWGEENIDFGDLQVKGLEFSAALNVELRARNMIPLNMNIDYRSEWNRIVGNKNKRIEPMKQGRYKTRWRRIKNDIDPRERGIF